MQTSNISDIFPPYLKLVHNPYDNILNTCFTTAERSIRKLCMSPLGETNYSGRGSGTEFCRTCTDFKTWAKLHTDKKPNVQSDSPSSSNSLAPAGYRDCPLDKDELGRSTWSFLHTMAAYYPDKPTAQDQKDMAEFFRILSKFYPCASCANHFRKELSTNPPAVASQETLSQWLCWVHNNVNKRIGKPLFDCSTVNQRWRDGYPDGSCN